jgi:hypothetical protein
MVAAAVLAAACSSDKATVTASITDAPNSALLLKQLDGTAVELLDTVRTDAAGTLAYKVKVQPGQPEFVYLYKGETRLASMLLEAGESVVVDGLQKAGAGDEVKPITPQPAVPGKQLSGSSQEKAAAGENAPGQKKTTEAE